MILLHQKRSSRNQYYDYKLYLWSSLAPVPAWMWIIPHVATTLCLRLHEGEGEWFIIHGYDDADCIPPRDTFPHQDSTGTAPSGTLPPAQPPPLSQTRRTQSHSAPTPLKRPMLTPEGGPRPCMGRGDASPNSLSALIHRRLQGGTACAWTHTPAGRHC